MLGLTSVIVAITTVTCLIFFGPGIWKNAKALFTADEKGFGALYRHSNRSLLSILRIGFNLFSYGLQVAISPILLILLLGQCLRTRAKRMIRRKSGEKPRLVWGPYPNANCVDLCKSLKAKGFVCDTVVYYNFDRIWDGSRFDFCLTDKLKSFPYVLQSLIFRTIGHVMIFMMIVDKYDIVHGFFWPGFLRDTFFKKIEVQLLHLAGCLQINTTVGGDVCVMPRFNSHLIKQGVNDMYPHDATPARQQEKTDWIKYYSKHSDFIILQCSYMIDMITRWDLLTTNYAPIDTEYWQGEADSGHNGSSGPVRIGHSPNHRPLKGSNFLIKAVNELRQEGLRIELVLLENHQNSEVRDILRGCDIVVADLVLQGYSIMAMEGMALSKPVVQDISDPHYNRVFKLYTGLDEAPFVSTPIEDLKENLRGLVTNPSRRKEIGERSRQYVLKYHSYDAVSRFWEWIYEDVWFKRRCRAAFYHPDWPLNPINSLNQIPQDDRMTNMLNMMRPIRAKAQEKSPGRPIAFFPFDETTFELAQTLYHSGAMASDDYLTIGPGKTPANAMHLPQAQMPVQELKSCDCSALCLLKTDLKTMTAAKKIHESSGLVIETGIAEQFGCDLND